MNAKLVIENSGTPLKSDDLDIVEVAIDRPLPKDYRAFLLAHNGGRPAPNHFDVGDAHFMGSVVHTFLGIHPADDDNDLLLNLEALEGCKENHLLPIAYDVYGHMLMLVLTEENYGHVNYFDSDEIPPRPYLVANDFNEFLSKLREPTPEELADIDNAADAPDDG